MAQEKVEFPITGKITRAVGFVSNANPRTIPRTQNNDTELWLLHNIFIVISIDNAIRKAQRDSFET